MWDQRDRWWGSMDGVRRVEGLALAVGAAVLAVVAIVGFASSGDFAALALAGVCVVVGTGAVWMVRLMVRERAGEWESEAWSWAVASQRGRSGVPEWVIEWQAQELLRGAIARGGPDRAVVKELGRRLASRPRYPVPRPVPPLPWGTDT